MSRATKKVQERKCIKMFMSRAKKIRIYKNVIFFAILMSRAKKITRT